MYVASLKRFEFLSGAYSGDENVVGKRVTKDERTWECHRQTYFCNVGAVGGDP